MHSDEITDVILKKKLKLMIKTELPHLITNTK